ncbi:hypothetical protein QOZ95_004752 [Paenibacillus brasilensis]|uniref:Uncharacterized protein n=1 Tax=Paenibacillus brasilensis TaxID=128574 RepID=A0ABU0L5G9_9BACL|nr:hypothetical protein [Paenibacillus brasilensis]
MISTCNRLYHKEGFDEFYVILPVRIIEEAKRLARPVDYDYLDLLEKKFYALRKYTPTLLKSLEFRSTKSAEPLMKAVDIIRDMNETGKRKVPEGARLNFVSNRWQKSTFTTMMEPSTGITTKWLS